MTDIRKVTYEEAMRLFGSAYRAENLPTKRVKNCDWYCNDYASGALIWVTPQLARIKATVTLPEWRGYGHGEAILQHLISEATHNGASTLEVFARNPAWYLKHGFSTIRVTSWGTTVCRTQLAPNPKTDYTPVNDN